MHSALCKVCVRHSHKSRAEEVEGVESNQVCVDCDVQDVANETSVSRAACGERCEPLSPQAHLGSFEG